jgi:hypothetical protein
MAPHAAAEFSAARQFEFEAELNEAELNGQN